MIPVGLALVLLHAAPALAAPTTFTITITNTSNSPWSAGLVTLAPLITIDAASPRSGQTYATYQFIDSDSTCTATCANCLGDPNRLAAQWGLTIGTNAWVVPALPAATSPLSAATVTFTATYSALNTPKVSYISRVSSGIDDMIAIHAVGVLNTLAVPLFNASGTPINPVAFEVAGYDVNTSVRNDATAASCSPACQPAVNGCWTASGNGTTGAALPAQPAGSPAVKLTLAGYTPDGIALGDVTGTAGNEIVVLCEGAQASGAITGAAYVIDRNMTTVDSIFIPTAGIDLLGFPMIENIDVAAGQSEYLVNNFVAGVPLPGGSSYARRGNSTTSAWTSTGYGYGGFWNMGPSAGDVRNNINGAGDEVVIADYDGDVMVLQRDTAAPVNTYDTFTSLTEHIYGHVALADFDGVAGSEIVAYGANTGKVMILKATAAGGAMTAYWQSIGLAAKLPAGQAAIASGPAVGDIDGDGFPEIVVAAGNTGAVYAYDPRLASHDCKYKWTATGGVDYSYTSPVIGDVMGDTKREVVVLSSDGLLSILQPKPAIVGTCVESTVAESYRVGGGAAASSWFTPALAQLTGSAKLDVVVANYTTLDVFDASLNALAFRYVDNTATFFPSAVIERVGNAASIYVSGWSNSTVYRIDLPAPAVAPGAMDFWPTFMGGNARTGAR